MMNIKDNNDLKEKLNKSITLPASVESKIKEAYQQIRMESGKDDAKVISYRRPKLKRWMTVAAAVALMLTTTVGVWAATEFFSKKTIQSENETIYQFDVDYELTPGVFEIEARYLPEGYIDNGEGMGKYTAGEEKWISASVNSTAGLAWLGNELEVQAKIIEKTTIANMEADVLRIERAGIEQNMICLFNPAEGYVAEVYGGADTSLKELKKFAENMEIIHVADGEKMTALEQAEIDKMIAEGEEQMADMDGKIAANQERGLTDEELFDIGEESFTGTLYGDGTRTKDLGYTITSVEYIDSLAGYEEDNFYDFETIKPWLNEDGSLKPYLRTEYEVALEGDVVEEKMVEQALLKVTMKVKRYQESIDSDGPSHSTELDGWLVPLQKRADESYTWNNMTSYFSTDNQSYEMHSVIYFDNAENTEGEARGSSFFWRDIKPGEEIEYTLIYVVDADMKDNLTIEMPGYTTEDEQRILHKTW